MNIEPRPETLSDDALEAAAVAAEAWRLYKHGSCYSRWYYDGYHPYGFCAEEGCPPIESSSYG